MTLKREVEILRDVRDKLLDALGVDSVSRGLREIARLQRMSEAPSVLDDFNDIEHATAYQNAKELIGRLGLKDAVMNRVLWSIAMDDDKVLRGLRNLLESELDALDPMAEDYGPHAATDEDVEAAAESIRKFVRGDFK